MNILVCIGISSHVKGFYKIITELKAMITENDLKKVD